MSITVHRRAGLAVPPPTWVREERNPSCSCAAPGTQLPLPTFGRTAQPHGPQFAHPAEEEFARLLTWHRVRWVYEPTVFAIDWDAAGAPIRSFRPDFYLPDLRLYLELTVMRQPLVTRKNRKLRLVREAYPSIRIKVLYRRDLERLRAAWREQEVAHRRALGEIVFGETEIAQRVRELSTQIADEWLGPGNGSDPAPLVLAACDGALRLSRVLHEGLVNSGIAADLDRLQRNRFRPGAGSRQVRFGRSLRLDLAGRRVLLVEDAVSSGLSAAAP